MSKRGLEGGPRPGKGKNSLAFLGLLSRFESQGVWDLGTLRATLLDSSRGYVRVVFYENTAC